MGQHLRPQVDPARRHTMNTTYTLTTIIVPAETVETYRSIAEALSPSGAGMFQVPLYTGQILSHYISTGKIWQEFVDLISDPEMFAQAMGVPIEDAEELQAGITYLAAGEGVDDNEEPILHNSDAIEALGLSLTPAVETEYSPP